METSTKVNGQEIKSMAKGNTLIIAQMNYMMASGLKEKNVEKVVLSMRMAIYMKATLRRVKEMVKE
jgi:hypothetical protein